MTQPSYMLPPQPGWWVRTGAVGAGSATFGWTATGSGAAAGGVAALTITETAATSASHSSSTGAALTMSAALLASFSSIGNAALTITETSSAPPHYNAVGNSALTITATATPGTSYGTHGDAALTITETPNAVGVQSVAYDATGTITDVSNQSSATINTTGTHTATAGADVFVWLGVLTSGAATPTFTATYDGASMTQLAFVKANNAQWGSIVLFHLANAPSGAKAIAASAHVTAGTVMAICGSSESYKNVGSIGTITTNYGQSTSWSVTATGVSNGMIIGMLGGGNTSAVDTLSAFNKTQRYLHSTTSGHLNDVAMVVGDTTATGSQSLSATCSDSLSQWAGIAAVLHQ